MTRASILTPARIAAGRAALAAPLKTLNGAPASLSEFLADPLIFLVWASW